MGRPFLEDPMDRKQLELVREQIPEHVRHLKGTPANYTVNTLADVCLAWQPGALEKVFLLRTPEGIHYALIYYPGLFDEMELLSRNQARTLFRRLPDKLASEEEAFPTPANV